MSGGHFEYIQYRIENAADQVQQYIDRCESSETDEYGYKPEFAADIVAKFRECEATLRRGAAMLNCVDYLACSDIGEDTFRKRWWAEALRKLDE